MQVLASTAVVLVAMTAAFGTMGAVTGMLCSDAIAGSIRPTCGDGAGRPSAGAGPRAGRGARRDGRARDARRAAAIRVPRARRVGQSMAGAVYLFTAPSAGRPGRGAAPARVRRGVSAKRVVSEGRWNRRSAIRFVMRPHPDLENGADAHGPGGFGGRGRGTKEGCGGLRGVHGRGRRDARRAPPASARKRLHPLRSRAARTGAPHGRGSRGSLRRAGSGSAGTRAPSRVAVRVLYARHRDGPACTRPIRADALACDGDPGARGQSLPVPGYRPIVDAAIEKVATAGGPTVRPGARPAARTLAPDDGMVSARHAALGGAGDPRRAAEYAASPDAPRRGRDGRQAGDQGPPADHTMLHTARVAGRDRRRLTRGAGRP